MLDPYKNWLGQFGTVQDSLDRPSRFLWSRWDLICVLTCFAMVFDG